MRVSIVVAVAENGVIGKNNALLWRLPDDLKFFKAVTMGKPVIMGRKTFDSIGKALPGRKNIVISRQQDLHIDGCVVVSSLQSALQAAAVAGADEVAIIGGAEIYRQAISLADVVHLTRVHATFEGDVFFSELSPDDWREINREEHRVDERHVYAFSFVTLEKRARNP